MEQCDKMFPYFFDGTKSTNSVRVKSVGKNLFDGKIGFTGRYMGSAGNTYSSLDYDITDYVKIPQVNNITISPIDGNSVATCFYDANKNYISGVNHGGNMESKTFSVPLNAKYIRSTLLKTKVVITQIEEGSTRTDYEPYKESIVNVNLPEPLRSLPNGVKDEVNVTTGVKTRKKKYVLHNDDKRSGINNDIITTSTPLQSDILTGVPENSISGTVMVPNIALYGNRDNLKLENFRISGGLRFLVSKETYANLYANLAEAQTALAGTTLIYQLATPIVTKLPAQAPLQVYENGTVYVEPLGDPSETTLPTVELTVPIASGNKVGIATHDYAGAVGY